MNSFLRYFEHTETGFFLSQKNFFLINFKSTFEITKKKVFDDDDKIK